MNLVSPEFASSDADAAQRAMLYADKDPFPSIPCALLSSAEIYDYARTTGMLYPFYPASLKSASYEAHIEGECIWWDEHDRKQKKNIKRGELCVLEPNSITFVQVEPKFRLPNYVAIRFNLRITHVHRGLLLGTGPLVDPGFEGKLLIPLHNLTSSKYHLDTNDALIWIEFTKTTFGCAVIEDLASEKRHFIPFPESKKNRTPDYYLFKASSGNPIRSSISDAITGSAKSAKSAADTAKTIRNLAAGIGVTAVVALVIALLTLYFQVKGMIQSSIALSVSVEQGLAPLAADAKATADKLTAAQAELIKLQQEVDRLTNQLAELKQPNSAVHPSGPVNRPSPR